MVFVSLTGVTNGTGTAYPPATHELAPVFRGDRCSLVLCIVFCRPLFDKDNRTYLTSIIKQKYLTYMEVFQMAYNVLV